MEPTTATTATPGSAELPITEIVVERLEYKCLYNTGSYENIELRGTAIPQPGQDPVAVYAALGRLVEGQAQAEEDRRAKVAEEREARYLAEQNARYERARAQREAAAGMVVPAHVAEPEFDPDEEDFDGPDEEDFDGDDKPF